MLNLIYLLELRKSKPPTSNDPHLQKTFNKLIWDDRNNIAIGRAIMAWLAIVGWIVAIFFAF